MCIFRMSYVQIVVFVMCGTSLVVMPCGLFSPEVVSDVFVRIMCSIETAQGAEGPKIAPSREPNRAGNGVGP